MSLTALVLQSSGQQQAASKSELTYPLTQIQLHNETFFSCYKPV